MGNKKMALRGGVAKEEEEWRDWSSLPEPLLLCIISLFTTLDDFFAFRRVCRSWRSAAIPSLQTMSSQSPLILFYRTFGFYKTLTKSFFDVAHGRHYLILPPCEKILGYSHGHLIVHKQPMGYSYIELVDLFTGDRTLQLSSRKGPQNPHRIRFSSSPSSPDCIAVILLENCEAFQYCYTTDRPMNWKRCPREDVGDILFFDNRLYVLTYSSQLWVLDPHSGPGDLVLLEATSPVPVEANDGRHNVYLAESDGELLMVCGSAYSPKCFIWRWKFESGGGWVSLSSLGLRSLFIDLSGFVASVPISESFGLRQNCVYFLNQSGRCSFYSLEEEMFHNLSSALPHVFMMDSPRWILPSVI